MFSHFRTAVRYFAIGLGIGLLTAPRRGDETRAMLRRQCASLFGTTEEQAGRAASQIQSSLQQTKQTAREATQQVAATATRARREGHEAIESLGGSGRHSAGPTLETESRMINGPGRTASPTPAEIPDSSDEPEHKPTRRESSRPATHGKSQSPEAPPPF